MRGADANLQFLFAERDYFRARVTDEFVAGNVELDVVDILSAAKPNRLADLDRAVRDHAKTLGVHVLFALVAQTARGL